MENRLCCVLNTVWTCRGCGAVWCNPCTLVHDDHKYIGEQWDGIQWNHNPYSCPVAGRVKVAGRDMAFEP